MVNGKSCWAALALALAVSACGGGGSGGDSMAEARKLLAARDYRTAAIVLKSALQKKSDSAELRFMLGKALVESGDPNTGRVELEKARELGYPDNELLPLLAKAMVQVNRAKEVVERFGRTQLPDTQAQADLLVALSGAYASLGQTENVVASINQALKVNPKHVLARVLTARFMAQRREFDAAWALTEQVLAEFPEDAAALHFKGLMQHYLKSDRNAAMASQQRALKSDPGMLAAHIELMSIYFAAGDKKGLRGQLQQLQRAAPQNLNTHLAHAQVEFLDGNLAAAREILQQLLRSKYVDNRVLMMAAHVESRLGALTLVETYTTRVLNATPTHAPARQLLAVTQVRMGNPERALQTLQPLLDEAKPDATTLSAAAEANMLVGKIAKAQELYERAAKLDPKDARLKASVALSRMARGQFQQGLTELDDIAANDEGSFADLALVGVHLRSKNFPAVIAVIDRLEHKRPRDPMPPSLRGRVHFSAGAFDKGRADFEKALSLDPSYFPAIDNLAALEVKERKFTEAKARYAAVIERDPNNLRALLALATLRETTNDPVDQVLSLFDRAVKRHPNELEARLSLVNFYLRKKDHKRAVAAVQEALVTFPDQVELLDVQGLALAANQEFQQAVNSFRKIAAIQPKAPLPHLRLADLYLQRKEPDAARASLRRVLEIAPNHVEANRMLFDLAVGDKDSKTAMAIAQRLDQANPKSPVGPYLEARAHSVQRNWSAAAASLRKSLQRGGSSEAAAQLHVVLLAGGKKAEAEEFQREWQTRNPKDVVFTLHLAQEALKAYQWADAERLYRVVVEAAPHHAIANNNVAWAMLQQGKPGALPFAEKAVQLSPDNASMLETLANALAVEGQDAKAMAQLTKALAIDQNHHGARLSLARLALKMGDKARAKAELQALAYLGAKFADQATVTELLRGLN